MVSFSFIQEENNRRGFLVFLTSSQIGEISEHIDSFDDLKRKDWNDLDVVLMTLQTGKV